MSYKIPILPLKHEIETKLVLKKVADARAALAELKGVHASVPNVGILLNTLALQEAKEWESWVLFMLEAIINVAKQSIELIKAMKQTMMYYKKAIRSEHPKIYSQDLLNNIFKHPYTKIDFLQQDLNVTRQTAAKYLDLIAENPKKLLEKVKIGRDNFYINLGLLSLFTQYDYNLKNG